MARLWRDQGKPKQACELLAPVYGWFIERFDTLHLKEAEALFDELVQSSTRCLPMAALSRHSRMSAACLLSGKRPGPDHPHARRTLLGRTPWQAHLDRCREKHVEQPVMFTRRFVARRLELLLSCRQFIFQTLDVNPDLVKLEALNLDP